MSGGLRRSLTDLLCRTLLAALPSSLQSWGWAVRNEAANIPDDTEALLFALDSLRGLMPRAIASHLLKVFASLSGDGAPLTEGSACMTILGDLMRRPRTLGAACAIGATLLGLAYMASAGAPMRYLGVNLAALAIGLALLGLFGRTAATNPRLTGVAIIAMTGSLVATAFLGSSVEGASRWVKFGGLAIQPSLILLPVMLVAFSHTRSVMATACMIAAAAAMALQPDRAMAGMLVLGLAVLTVTRRDRHVVVALVAAIVAFAMTLVRADALPAVAYVDQILFTAFDVHAAAGLAVLAGSALLLVPGIVGWNRDVANHATYAAFAAVWFAAILAAALGNYPTPIVGYGGSAIIGYVLSLLALPKRAETQTEAVAKTGGAPNESHSDRHLSVALA